MLSKKEVDYLRKEIETSTNPLFIFDDDGDGLASFLLLYKIKREGRGISPKTGKLELSFVKKVEEINPDKIFVLDLPLVEQEFIDAVNRPFFWIDHHEPLERKKIHYYNPRIKHPGVYLPTTRMAWQISRNEDDLWIATVGCLADWYMPDFIAQFIQKYPFLLPEKKNLVDAVYHQKVGLLVKLFFFILKGPTSEVKKSVKILTRIKTPEEILNQETAPGKYLWKRYEKVNQKYQLLLQEAKKYVTQDKLLLYYYSEQQWSFTAILSNELNQLYPEKVILICRQKGDKIRCSLRAHFPIVEKLKKALVGIKGYGGGHPNACGAVIEEEDWPKFLENFQEELKQE